MMKYKIFCVAWLSLLYVTGCAAIQADIRSTQQVAIKKFAEPLLDPATERDNLFMLLAYATVLKDWQDTIKKHDRGYNIGSVLVDPGNKVVFWARNAVNIAGNRTQHGEVRLINCFLAQNRAHWLKGYTLYTTLEPCAMCSGMMMLTHLKRTVYGQTDPSYGRAIERLELDSTAIPEGYPPYPRYVISEASKLVHRHWLDNLYSEYQKKHPDPNITGFLATQEAKLIYEDAFQTLKTYQLRHSVNQPILEQVLVFYKTVSDRYTKLCPQQ